MAKYGDSGIDYESDASRTNHAPDSKHPLDSHEAEEIRKRLYDWWYEARVAASANRYEMATDDDFADGLQWTEEDKQELANRHQAPLVFNEVKPAVEWILGTEKRTRMDWRVLPRTEEDAEAAENKTSLLKYLDDTNKAPWKWSRAFRDATTVGVGWMEIGLRADIEEEPLFLRRESWRNMWYDWLSVEPDLSDARYIFRTKVIDTDVAVIVWPERENEIRQAALTRDRLPYWVEDDYFDTQLYYDQDGPKTIHTEDALGVNYGRREGVRLVEAWHRMPARVKVMRGIPEFHGDVYDEANPRMKQAVDDGVASLFDAVRMIVYLSIFIEGGAMLQHGESPYRHNRFPFVPLWGYRRGRDNAPYGVVRNTRDPQEDLNKRRSKALFILSTNQIIMDEDAVEDRDELEEQAARPDGVIEKKPGKHFEIRHQEKLAEEQLLLAQQDADYIRQGSGVTGENLGMETNATSGKAILARQNQGSVVTTTLFDNLRLARQVAGEIALSVMEQTYGDQKVIRLTNDIGGLKFQTLNGFDPQTGEFVNDITASHADFKISEQDYKESLRMAMFETLFDMLGKLPGEIALEILDVVLEFWDVPGKDEIVARIRAINGHPDPRSPEAKAEAEARDASRKQLDQQRTMAELRALVADAREKEAKADKTTADAEGSRISTILEALDAALKTVQVPEAAVVADDLILGARADTTQQRRLQNVQ